MISNVSGVLSVAMSAVSWHIGALLKSLDLCDMALRYPSNVTVC